MKEEGFVERALNCIKEEDIHARFLVNQALFNDLDNSKIQSVAKVSIAFALHVLNQNNNDLSDLIPKAGNVKTVGGMKKIINEAEQRINNRN